MTVQEWVDAGGGNMKHLGVRSPSGDEWSLANAWRVGTEEPARVGLMLLPLGQETGLLKTVFVPLEEFLSWTVTE